MEKTSFAVLRAMIFVGFAMQRYGAGERNPLAPTVRGASKTNDSMAKKMLRFKGGSKAMQELVSTGTTNLQNQRRYL